jgi:hypothetical protein
VLVRPSRSLLGFATLALLLLGLIPPLAGAAMTEAEATERLAQKFSPITMLRDQKDPPCDTAEEQYQPTTVDTVLGNPAVTLTRNPPDGPQEVIRKAPTAADIVGLGDEYHLDLPGDPLDDTCDYARDFEKLKAEGKAPVATYAHLAREPGHSGFVLQYWFFWYFNQFNDLHEGDWEGMQISFEADEPAEALAAAEEPHEIIVFQHAGGERASWGDGKVQKEGNHPIVYPAAGSHATFYDSAVYVENGQEGSGLGCDNTSEPLRELRPHPVLLPNFPVDSGRFEWLSFYGHWGEKEQGFNNGPTGPQTKTVWREPFTWMAAQRDTSPRLPGGSIAGPQITKAFCGAVATASELINLNYKSKALTIAILAVAAIVIGLFVFATRWGPVDLTQLRARRSFGQILRAAARLYRKHWRVVLPVAVLGLVFIGGVGLLAGLLATSGGSGEDRTGFNLAGGDLLEGLARPVATALVAALVIVAVRLRLESEEVTLAGCWRGMRERIWRVVGAQLLATLGVIALALTIVGIPLAIWKLVGWAFVQQEVLFTDKRLRDAFSGSSDLVRGRWWHSLRTVLFLTLLGLVLGPMLTFALIFTALPLFWINLIGAAIFALIIPFVALGLTLQYFDLQVRAEEEGVKPGRSWKVWRPRRFGRVERIGFSA